MKKALIALMVVLTLLCAVSCKEEEAKDTLTFNFRVYQDGKDYLLNPVEIAVDPGTQAGELKNFDKVQLSFNVADFRDMTFRNLDCIEPIVYYDCTIDWCRIFEENEDIPVFDVILDYYEAYNDGEEIEPDPVPVKSLEFNLDRSIFGKVKLGKYDIRVGNFNGPAVATTDVLSSSNEYFVTIPYADFSKIVDRLVEPFFSDFNADPE